MNAKTVDLIYKHAVIAQKNLAQFLNQSSQADLFRKYFHLRPTSDGVTIVSTLPQAPMRGISVKNTDELKSKLENIGALLSKLVSDDNELIVATLTDLGFKQRSEKNERSQLEEDVQAIFIRGMIADEPAYNGIQFVASELNLEDSMRFDVVGYCASDDTLYLFELKKGRTTDAANQVSKYCYHVEKYKKNFEKILSTYPNLSVNSFSHVKGIAVMEFAENSRDSLWEKNAEKYDVDIWMYRSALSFKRYPR